MANFPFSDIRNTVDNIPSDMYQMSEQSMMQGANMRYSQNPGISHSNHNARTRDDMLSFLKSATKQTLLASENPAFFELFEENMRLRAELQAKGEIVNHLKENALKEIAVKLPATSIPAKFSSQAQAAELVVPDALPPANQQDYPNVGFWHPQDWRKFKEQQNEIGQSYDKLGFLTDQNGDIVSEDRIGAMGKFARSLWASLYFDDLEPRHWSSKLKISNDFFANSMSIKFEEFRWCSDNWKADAFATQRYPEWKSRAPSTLIRRNPKPRPGKRPNDVIEVDSDSDGSVQVIQRKSVPSKKARHHGKSRAQISLPLSTVASQDTVASTSNATSSGSNTTSTTASPAIEPTSPACSPSSGAPSPPPILAVRKPNILSDLAIPKPAEGISVPVKEKVQASTAASGSETPNARASVKSGKMLASNGTMSARNLYTIDYLQEHGPTSVADFKVIWDALDRKIIKEYTAKALAAKKGAKPAARA